MVSRDFINFLNKFRADQGMSFVKGLVISIGSLWYKGSHLKRLNIQKAKKNSQSIISCPMVLPKCAWILKCICKSCHFIWIEGRTILSTLMHIGWPNIFEWRALHHSFIVGKQLHFNITLAKGHQFGKYNPFHLRPKNTTFQFKHFQKGF